MLAVVTALSGGCAEGGCGGVFPFRRSHGGSDFRAFDFGGPKRSDMSRAIPPGLTAATAPVAVGAVGTAAGGGGGTATPVGGGGTLIVLPAKKSRGSPWLLQRHSRLL